MRISAPLDTIVALLLIVPSVYANQAQPSVLYGTYKMKRGIG
jgi:hypothetical protein